MRKPKRKTVRRLWSAGDGISPSGAARVTRARPRKQTGAETSRRPSTALPAVGREYRIGEIAAKVGISADTLRYYERLGILPRARRTSGGLRQYGDDVIRHVQFIHQAQALGLTLKDVRQLVSDQGRAGRDRCRHVRDLLVLRLADIDAKLAELWAFRETLRTHLADCERALEQENAACPVITALAGTHR